MINIKNARINDWILRIDMKTIHAWIWIWNNFSTRNFKLSMIDCVRSEIVKVEKGKKIEIIIDGRKWDFEDYMVEFSEESIYWK